MLYSTSYNAYYSKNAKRASTVLKMLVKPTIFAMICIFFKMLVSKTYTIDG